MGTIGITFVRGKGWCCWDNTPTPPVQVGVFPSKEDAIKELQRRYGERRVHIRGSFADVGISD